VTGSVVAAPAALSPVLIVLAVSGARRGRPRLPESSGPATRSRGRRRSVGRRIGALPLVRSAAGVTGDEASERRLGIAVGAGGLVTVLLLLGPAPAPLLAPIVFVLSIRAPRWIEARSSRVRRTRIDREVTQFLDALAATSTAGLSAPLGIRRATTVVVGPLRDELDRLLRSVDLGARWRDELRLLAERSGVVDLRRAVAVITRTETLGSSLAASTIELADRVRAGRRQRATERARTAPVKMLFPLVFLVLPAFLLLTVVPVLLTTLQSIR